MNVQQTIKTLKLLGPKMSVILEGKHGLGKSQIVAQTAAELSKSTGKDFGFVDIRLGQYEVGDLIGLPTKRDTFTVTHKIYRDGEITESNVVAQNVTVHDLPLWFPRDKDSCGFLFFDELNRGSRDTQQWAFQVVLDYRVNFVDVPEGWRVIAAINNTDDYSVQPLDPALYSRFLAVQFKPTVPEWLDHAEKIGVHDAVVKYIRKFGNDLDSPERLEAGKRYPDRRSWVALSKAILHAKTLGEDLLSDLDYLMLLAKGYIGDTVAINFVEYIRKDYKVYSAEEILNNFPKLEKEFTEMISSPMDLNFYNGEIVKYLKDNPKTKLTKKQKDNLLLYVKTIPKEQASGFFGQLLKDAREIATDWYADLAVKSYFLNEVYKKEENKKGA